MRLIWFWTIVAKLLNFGTSSFKSIDFSKEGWTGDDIDLSSASKAYSSFKSKVYSAYSAINSD